MTAEYEILASLRTEFRSAASDCELLAKLPARGPTYRRFRETIKSIEWNCRLMARSYREDARWLTLGMQMAEVHKRAGTWLRAHPRTENSNVAHPLFLKLAENLRAAERNCEILATRATGRRGPILPVSRPLHRETRPVQVQLPSGLIVPVGLLAP